MRRMRMLAMVAVLTMLVSWGGRGVALAAPTAYYVSGTGSDSNDGRSPNTPFRTIQRAADLTNPGDTVYIMDGVYNDISTEGVVQITRSGLPGLPITYTVYPGHHPLIAPISGWNGILIAGASYIIIDGLEIRGNNDNITLAEAEQNANPNSPTYNTNCLLIRQNNATGAIPHHIIVRNNDIHKCAAGGIATVHADHLTIERNRVHSNAWYSIYANSGISIYEPVDVDSYTGYKMFVRNNIAYDNESRVKWYVCNCYSDGNGIIIDDTKHTQDNGRPYNGRTLVVNNISFNNGGSGIHAYASEHVDIVNNTAYLNSRFPALNYANIAATESSDAYVLNNVSYVRAGEPTNWNYRNRRVTYDYNIYYNGLAPETMGRHDLIADPQFVNPSTDPAVADFHVQRTSPAIDSGTAQKAPNTDYDGVLRPQGAWFDRGAYEFVGP